MHGLIALVCQTSSWYVNCMSGEYPTLPNPRWSIGHLIGENKT
jgi:hypothetical protein